MFCFFFCVTSTIETFLSGSFIDKYYFVFFLDQIFQLLPLINPSNKLYQEPELILPALVIGKETIIWKKNKSQLRLLVKSIYSLTHLFSNIISFSWWINSMCRCILVICYVFEKRVLFVNLHIYCRKYV